MTQTQYAFPIKEITPLPCHRVYVVFSNGIQGRVDLSWVPDLPGYQGLRDPEKFANVSISPAGMIEWEKDMDISWEGVYERLSGKHWITALPPSKKMIQLVVAEQLVEQLVGAEQPEAGSAIHVEFNNGVCGEVSLDGLNWEDADTDENPTPDKYSQQTAGLHITDWGSVVCEGREYDTAQIYQKLTGKDIDQAIDEWNS